MMVSEMAVRLVDDLVTLKVEQKAAQRVAPKDSMMVGEMAQMRVA